MSNQNQKKVEEQRASSVEFMFAEPKNVFFKSGFLRMEIPQETIKRAAEAGARLIVRKHKNYYTKVMSKKGGGN